MILITGATGFIGRHLVQRLVERGERPRCLVRNISRAARLLPAEKVELVEGATTLPLSLEPALRGVDTVIHAAFMTADRKQSAGNTYEGTNVAGTTNLVNAALAAGVRRMIELSGLGTKPDRPGSYMQGRYLAEEVLKKSALAWTIIQPSVLFGKGAPFFKGLADLIRSAPVVPLIGGGALRFQPIYVEDVVTVILRVLDDPEGSRKRTFVIGGPEYYTFAQIIELLMQTLQVRRPMLPLPLFLARIGATAMELLLPKPPITRAALTLFTFDNITALDAVERQFGFQPLSLRSYLAQTGKDGL
ncbi:complex I NDUFA9 subunit family protein [Thermogemmatispora sp.]|uniref:complex I NDUFA9 subunit family protein n=1 Tax=Thermogemmatispora sp. TaxID=1968838 RepID=UPI001D3FC93C|nr:complex I NDUFA9 subunit family protein [Thermogemmatispora sp.]MBX5449303.1 complex I NDUFA9 subunit family protein [Thermogemmatispora sp.]